MEETQEELQEEKISEQERLERARITTCINWLGEGILQPDYDLLFSDYKKDTILIVLAEKLACKTVRTDEFIDSEIHRCRTEHDYVDIYTLRYVYMKWMRNIYADPTMAYKYIHRDESPMTFAEYYMLHFSKLCLANGAGALLVDERDFVLKDRFDEYIIDKLKINDLLPQCVMLPTGFSPKVENIIAVGNQGYASAEKIPLGNRIYSKSIKSRRNTSIAYNAALVDAILLPVGQYRDEEKTHKYVYGVNNSIYNSYMGEAKFIAQSVAKKNRRGYTHIYTAEELLRYNDKQPEHEVTYNAVHDPNLLSRLSKEKMAKLLYRHFSDKANVFAEDLLEPYFIAKPVYKTYYTREFKVESVSPDYTKNIAFNLRFAPVDNRTDMYMYYITAEEWADLSVFISNNSPACFHKVLSRYELSDFTKDFLAGKIDVSNAVISNIELNVLDLLILQANEPVEVYKEKKALVYHRFPTLHSYIGYSHTRLNTHLTFIYKFLNTNKSKFTVDGEKYEFYI